VRPDARSHPDYVEAFGRIIRKIVSGLGDVDPRHLPIRLYVAGGAALHLLVGGRVSMDIDGVFSRRVVIADDLEVSYRDPDGRARVLYLDRNYNDTLGLMHEDAQKDSQRLDLPGLDGKVVEVRLLSPLDLAVSKLARFSEQDREDIRRLAEEGLVDARRLRARAEDALKACIGDTRSVRTSIDLACRTIEGIPAPAGKAASRKPKRR
jgi:hypothetical protein